MLCRKRCRRRRPCQSFCRPRRRRPHRHLRLRSTRQHQPPSWPALRSVPLLRVQLRAYLAATGPPCSRGADLHGAATGSPARTAATSRSRAAARASELSTISQITYHYVRSEAAISSIADSRTFRAQVRRGAAAEPHGQWRSSLGTRAPSRRSAWHRRGTSRTFVEYGSTSSVVFGREPRGSHFRILRAEPMNKRWRPLGHARRTGGSGSSAPEVSASGSSFS